MGSAEEKGKVKRFNVEFFKTSKIHLTTSKTNYYANKILFSMPTKAENEIPRLKMHSY